MVSLARTDHAAPIRQVGVVVASLVLWALLYSQLDRFSHLVVATLAIPPGTRLHDAATFFAYPGFLKRGLAGAANRSVMRPSSGG